ncbi:uncharacterized protein LOC110036489 [Phalaenopsis equestris]|uniref:uncharacterized protein LOC110036489 n=1 Tax=Phalaenopsis equestris TaxID=78828 RepID=UPI0009E58E53|nr:uncharacterized protein LOC110036489 [Phalaenopsis equestris]
MLNGFNKKGQKTLGSITLPLQFGDFKSEAKFHVIDGNTSYRALLGRPWIHEYGMVPSTLHQCIKYMRGGEEFSIPGDVHPFSINEVGVYDDAEYYVPHKASIPVSILSGCPRAPPLPSSLIVKDREVKEQEERRRAPVTSKHELELPILPVGKIKIEAASDSGSDLDEALPVSSSSRDDVGREILLLPLKGMVPRLTRLSLSDEVLTIDPMPRGHHKELTITHASTVEELKTFYVPPKLESKEKGILFYKTVPHVLNTDVMLLDDENEEVEDIPLSYYCSPLIYKMLDVGLLPERWSIRQSKFCKAMWQYKPPGERSGLGYVKKPNKVELHRASCRTISVHEDIETIASASEEIEIKDAPPELEDGVSSTIDELVEVNLGTTDDPRPTYISKLLTDSMTVRIIEILKEFRDSLAWSYAEMPGLAPDVAIHHLAINPSVVLVKQTPRRMRPEIEQKVIEETKKLIDAGFIREVIYPTWLANIVPVRKKNGQIRVCIDFRDLNKACPKDDFPLPIPELMIDIASSHAMFSFMDGLSDYNQIRMAPDGEKHTAFRTPISIFCYKVMPFGLKNAGATY